MGGGNCLFGIELDRTTPIFRGNKPVVEVASEVSNPTAIPNTGTWHVGSLSSTKYFDISIAGKCEAGVNGQVRLNIQPANKIPDFFTKNSEGKIVFAEPQIVGTIKAAKGHNSWIQIELKTINGGTISDVAKHACLGIKKNDEDHFFDIIHAGNLISRYIDVTQESYVELVPLLSKTSTTESSGCIATTPGDEIGFTDITIPTTGSFNFGSVYRINVSVHDSQWINVPCDLCKLNDNGKWENNGHIGVGQVGGKKQLLAINKNSAQLASSVDGMRWNSVADIGDVPSGSFWAAGMSYGNGVWCAVDYPDGKVRYSIDEARNWRVSQSKLSDGIFAIVFGKDKFVAVSSSGIVYASVDADSWREVANLNMGIVRVLGYGDNKWMCADFSGNVYNSEDGIKWTSVNSNLKSVGKQPHGGVFSNGYFHAIDDYDSDANYIINSSNGETWTKVFNLNCPHGNVTYFNNKLYLVSGSGDHCHIGLLRPDGTVDEI